MKFLIWFSFISLIICIKIIIEIKERLKKVEEVQSIYSPIVDTRNNKLISSPTSEKIYITISPAIGEILMYFFPNSFKNIKEAESYYLNFCRNAKALGEEKCIYEIQDSLILQINIDHLSGLYTVYNCTNNTLSSCLEFNFFNYRGFKNPELKEKFKKLCDDNEESLKSICHLAGSDQIWTPGNLYFLPNGIKCFGYLSPEEKPSRIPFGDILDILRIAKTYGLRNTDDKEKITKLEQDRLYLEGNQDIKYKIDYKDLSAEISNKFLKVYINTKYFYPSESAYPVLSGTDYGFKCNPVDIL